jgi:hypothetical protein
VSEKKQYVNQELRTLMTRTFYKDFGILIGVYGADLWCKADWLPCSRQSCARAQAVGSIEEDLTRISHGLSTAADLARGWQVFYSCPKEGRAEFAGFFYSSSAIASRVPAWLPNA